MENNKVSELQRLAKILEAFHERRELREEVRRLKAKVAKLEKQRGLGGRDIDAGGGGTAGVGATMRKHLTLPNLLRVIGTIQLLVLYAWGLWKWPLGTLLISTALIAVELWLENTKEARKP